MKSYAHNKIDLAIAVGRNLSKHIKEPVYVQTAGIKSIKSMKYIDTTMIQVFSHSELPLPTHTAIINKMFLKGKERKNY